MGWIDWTIILALGVCVILALRHIHKLHKSGKCSCGCSSCPYSNDCTKSNKKSDS